MAAENDDDPNGHITRILGPCPVPRDDPRYESWVDVGNTIWEAQARLQATMLDKAATVPFEQLPSVYLDTVVGHYDIAATLIAATVTDYPSAAERDKTLQEASNWIEKWAISELRTKGPRHIRESVSEHDIRTRLRARMAHWRVKIISAAREATTARSARRAAESTASHDAHGTMPGDGADKVPVIAFGAAAPCQNQSSKRFPNRAAWLQAQLDERHWQTPDVRRFNGPDSRTVRKMLEGEPVKQVVLEKLVQALSTKRLVRLSDVPAD